MLLWRLGCTGSKSYSRSQCLTDRRPLGARQGCWVCVSGNCTSSMPGLRSSVFMIKRSRETLKGEGEPASIVQHKEWAYQNVRVFPTGVHYNTVLPGSDSWLSDHILRTQAQINSPVTAHNDSLLDPSNSCGPGHGMRHRHVSEMCKRRLKLRMGVGGLEIAWGG